MPAKRRTTAPKVDAASPESPHPDDPLYQMKRKKNNEAVQRTREKSKKSAEDRKKRINNLRDENQKLKEQIEGNKAQIKLLKELIIQGEKSEDHHRIIQDILDAPPSDEEEQTDNKRSK